MIHGIVKMRAPSTFHRSILLILMAGGLSLLLAGVVLWGQSLRQAHRLADLNRRLAVINGQGPNNIDPQQLDALAAAAREVGLSLPEVEYARLYGQWQQAVTLFDRLRGLLANPYLAERTQQAAGAFHAHLLDLRDAAANSLADGQNLPPAWRWKIHNLKGSTEVLLAYSMLYTEKDGRKAAKFLADALDDYKEAIVQVDRASLAPFDRALPRWNLELIVAVGEYRRLGLSEIAPPDIDRVQQQLETFIPEVPGFSPGAPLETRVEK